jgi:putative heme transporter
MMGLAPGGLPVQGEHFSGQSGTSQYWASELIMTEPRVPAAQQRATRLVEEQPQTTLPPEPPASSARRWRDPDSPPWSVTTKAIVTIGALALIVLIIWRFQELIRPLVVAAIIAYLLNPVIVWLMGRVNIGRGTAVVIVYFVGLILLVVGLVVVGFVAFDQVSRLASLLPDSMSELVDWGQRQIDNALARLSLLVGYDLRSLARFVELQEVVQQAVALVQATLRRSGSLAAQVAQTTISTLTSGLLIFFVSLYIAKDSPQLGQAIGEVAQQPGYRRDAERLMRDFLRIWDAYLRGQIILGLVIGVVVSVTLAALGVNNALGLGIVSGVLEFLPVIGPLIGTAAAVLVALFQPENYLGISSLYHALIVLGAMFLIQQVENNLLVPGIVGDALDLHPLVIMISVIMGASLAGILGAILAAPVVASLKLFGVYAWRKLLDLPPFPDPEPPPKPKRGQQGWAARWRLWRLRLGNLTAGRRK